MGFAWVLCGHEFQKNVFQKKLNYDFGGISTTDLCYSFLTDKPLSQPWLEFEAQSSLVSL